MVSPLGQMGMVDAVNEVPGISRFNVLLIHLQ